jgi:hypothetical protein
MQEPQAAIGPVLGMALGRSHIRAASVSSRPYPRLAYTRWQGRLQFHLSPAISSPQERTG